MKYNWLVLFFLIFTTQLNICYCQDAPNIDLSLIKRENIEFEALKPYFYLIRQDYIIESETGEKLKLGGNDFFGRGFGIGILTQEKKLWFPKFIRFPWDMDDNFEEYRGTHKPECTLLKIKNILDTVYNIFEYNDLDLNQQLLNIPYGLTGIPLSEELINSGSLIIFYSSHPVPEKFDDISYSIIYLDEVTWENNEISNIRVPYLGNQQILGGGFFQRIIKKGVIQWKLSGIYAPVNEKWIIIPPNKI